MQNYLIRQDNAGMYVHLNCQDGSSIQFPVQLTLGDCIEDEIYRKWARENPDVGTPVTEMRSRE